ncbi:MAG: DUF2268 domain-containing putative Zn-dependent protease [Candidatus Saccharibacteria bacterium]
MIKVNLLVANANDNFSSNQLDIFNQAVVAVEKFIADNFDLDYEVDVVVVSPSYLLKTIPEDGIGGRTYRSDLIVITVDTESELSEDFFYETLCHELSHSIRWNQVSEHTVTLLDDIVLEGLAIVLEEKAMNDSGRPNVQYFLKQMHAMDEQTANDILANLKNKLNDKEYDYEKTFISGDEDLPRWAGYKLGYWLIKESLANKCTEIASATLDSYKNLKNNLKTPS